MPRSFRKRPAQFKLYFSAEEKAQLLALAKERREKPSDILRALLREEILHVKGIKIEEARSARPAAVGVDRWREARRLRREREQRAGA